MFSAVPRASSTVLMFCVFGLVFGGTKGVGSCFHVFCTPRLVFGGNEGIGSCLHVLRSRRHFRRYGGRGVPFSYFALRARFPAVFRAFDPVLMFSAPRLVFCGTEGVGSHFYILLSQTRFRRYRGRRVPFSCFARPDSFSAVPRA
jgi:hypothetical protein